MDQNDRMLLRKALTQAFAEKFDEELAVCGMTAACSEEHTRRMEAMLRRQARSQRRKTVGKWVAAILVAAALLLTAITVGAHYKEIKAFFEKIYEDHIHLTFNEGEHVPENEELDKRYTLGYVPEGYTLKRTETYGQTNYYQWENADGEYIVFEQYGLLQYNGFLDSEAGESAIIRYSEYEVYCKIQGTGACTYIWNDGEYAYMLLTSNSLSEDTLERILSGILEAE